MTLLRSLAAGGIGYAIGSSQQPQTVVVPSPQPQYAPPPQYAQPAPQPQQPPSYRSSSSGTPSLQEQIQHDQRVEQWYQDLAAQCQAQGDYNTARLHTDAANAIANHRAQLMSKLNSGTSNY